jgi:hypothetical protein
MLGGHPGLGRLFHKLLADRVRTGREKFGGARAGWAHRGAFAEQREELLEAA